jgi:hypothetical protein
MYDDDDDDKGDHDYYGDDILRVFSLLRKLHLKYCEISFET